jgi:Mg/Co/Ni transporter MgtE
MLPNNKIGDVIYNLPSNDLPEIINALPDNKKTRVIKSLPSNMLNGVDVYNMRDDIPLFDISSIHDEILNHVDIPKIVSANDFGHMIKDIPDIGSILGNDIGLSSSIFGGMNGYISGGILKNNSELLSKFSDGDIGNILNSMPVSDLSSMIGGTDLLSSFSSDSLGKMFDGLQGADMSSILSNVPDMNSLMTGLNISDFGNVMSSIPNINMDSLMENMDIADLSSMLSDIPFNDLGSVLNNVDLEKSGEMLECMAPDKLDSIINDANMGEAMTSSPKIAAYPSRIPMHEPWGRSNTKSDTDKSSKYSYDDENVGKNDGKRNSNWKR